MLTSVCLIVLVSSIAAQQAQYGAPSSGYDAGTSYAASPSYDYGDYGGGYDQAYVATQEDGGLDLSGIGDLIPIFIVVFAAIIAAQLLSPLLLQLLGLLVGVIPMALSVKLPIINAILTPFGCTITCTKRSFDTKRSFQESFADLGKSNIVDFSPDQLNIMADFADRAVEALSGKNITLIKTSPRLRGC